MKRIFYLILSLVALGTIAWLSVDVADAIHARKKAARHVQMLPSFEVTDLDGERFNTAATDARGTMLLFFTTTCPFCRDEIADIVSNTALFEHTRVLLLSGEATEVLRQFCSLMEIDERSHFTVGVDEGHVVARHFGIRKVPAAFVYDRRGQLIRRFDGLARASKIAAALDDPLAAGEDG